MSRDIMVADLVNYVRKNRRGNAFKDWAFDTLIARFADGIDERTLYYSVDHEGNINGVALGTLSADKKSLYIDSVLTTAKDVLKKFIIHVHCMYPDVQLCAHRYNQFITYDTLPV